MSHLALSNESRLAIWFEGRKLECVWVGRCGRKRDVGVSFVSDELWYEWLWGDICRVDESLLRSGGRDYEAGGCHDASYQGI